MVSRFLMLGILLAVHMTSTVEAAPAKPSRFDGTCGESPTRPMRVTVRHIESNGIGYNQGYTTLEGFFSPIHPWKSWVPFLDLRGHVFNNGKLAANAGLGIRYIACSRIYGINAYYDYRDTHHQHYNQVSLGLESLGRVWDFRINGYLPVGDKTSSFYRPHFEEFKGNNIILSRKREFALKAANAEAGFHLDHFKHVPLYFAAGPYYLTGEGKTSWGGEARVVVDIFDYVSVQGNTSYDTLFKWIGQGQLSVNIPFGAKRKVKACRPACYSKELTLSTRSLQRVDRNEIVPVDRKRVRSKAIDPTTGEPYLVWFVDNTSHSAGTYESPFPTLLAAHNASGPNDIIYIFPGDQTTTGMDQGITLLNGQRLWGSAVAHPLPTTAGGIQIPALSNGPFVNNTFGSSIALLPIITLNGIGDVVTIANNNEISGVYILHTAGNGITGNSVSNLTVLHSTIQGLSGEGIFLTDLGGTLLVDSNTISSGPMNSGINMNNTTANINATISNNQILAGADGCVWTLSTQGALQFTGNTINAGIDALNMTTENGSNLVATISNNHMEMFGSGVALTANGPDANITVNSNFMDGGGDSPNIIIEQTAGSLTAMIANNQIMGYSQGFFLNASGSNAVVTLQSNQITPGSGNPSSPPAIEIDQTAGALIATITSNQTISAEQGFLLNAGGSAATVSLQSNTMTSYYGHAIDLEQTSGALTVLAANNNLSAQDNNGFNYANSKNPSSTALLAVIDNIIQGYHPIVISQQGGTTISTVTNNILTSNFIGSALTLTLNNGTQIANLSKNTVTQSNGDGFDLFFVNTGTAIWNVNGNAFYGVASNAANISTNGTSGVNASICVEFNDNIAYPIQLEGQGTYLLSNTGNTGTFTLNPPVGNIGDFTDYTATGVVTGTCP